MLMAEAIDDDARRAERSFMVKRRWVGLMECVNKHSVVWIGC